MTFLGIPPELDALGLTPFFRQQLITFDVDALGPALHAGRIVCERRGEYEVLGAERAFRATLRGRLVHELSNDERLAVGDWVLVEPAEPVGRIHALFERQSALRRVEVDGSSRAQTLAANVDVCFVVAALSADDAGRHVQARTLNARRIERSLVAAREGRIPAVVVVNKADLASDPDAAVSALRSELGGVETLLVSAETGAGIGELRARIPRGTTGVLLGASGVGKSSLTNRLLERPLLRTGGIRGDDARGRHTTTERQLELLPGGGMLIDTPGLRELAVFAEADAATTGFSDVDELAERCRFGDCRHDDEPGCAVRAAIAEGTLSAARLEHARKLERERHHQRSRTDARLRNETKRKWRAIARSARERTKAKRGE